MPGPLPTVGEDPVQRLVAAWLLGYESRATRGNNGADLAGWLLTGHDHDAGRPHGLYAERTRPGLGGAGLPGVLS